MPVPKVRIGPLRSLRFPRAQQHWQYARSGRRYASGGAGEKAQQGAQQLSSDMPWLIGAVAVTIPATYFVAGGHKFTDPISHPLPGDNYHGEEHDDEHEEEEGDEKGGDEESEEGGDEESAKKDEKEGGEKDGEDDKDQEGSDDSNEGEKGDDDKKDDDDSEKESAPASKKK